MTTTALARLLWRRSRLALRLALYLALHRAQHLAQHLVRRAGFPMRLVQALCRFWPLVALHSYLFAIGPAAA